jgi:hypothetical protein
VSPRTLVRLSWIYVVALAATCALIRVLASPRRVEGALVATVYKDGARVARRVVPSEMPADVADLIEQGTLAYEQVEWEAPVARWPDALLSLSFVPGKDGVVVRVDDRTAYVTPDELLLMQGYDHGIAIDAMGLSLGVDLNLVAAIASRDLGVVPSEVMARATFSRARFSRRVPAQLPAYSVTRASLGPLDVQRGVRLAGKHLARGVSERGRFRYLIDAGSGKTLLGYDWPRHAGASYFLVQAAALNPGDDELRRAALRALGALRTDASQDYSLFVGFDGTPEKPQKPAPKQRKN